MVVTYRDLGRNEVSSNQIQRLLSDALSLEKQNDLDAALNNYEKILELHPNCLPALTNKGIILSKMNRHEEALECFSYSPSPSIASYNYYLAKGTLLQSVNSLDLAEITYDNAIMCVKKPLHAFIEKGICYMKNKNWFLAIESFENALNIKKNSKEALLMISFCYFSIGNFKRAEALYKKCLSIDYNDLTVFAYSQFLIGSANYNKAIPYLRKLKHDSQFYENALALQTIIDYINATSIAKLSRICNMKKLNNLQEKSLFTYFTFISLLSHWHLKHPGWFTELSHFSGNIIYLIGESHAITANQMTINFFGEDYLCKTKWIMGVKLYHLSTIKNNRFKEALLNQIKSISRDAPILICIGEIDTRSDEGFLKHYGNDKDHLIQNIEEVVKQAFIFFANALASHKGKVIIQAVPSPVISSNTENKNVEDMRKLVIETLNKNLMQQCSVAGYYFLDIYSMTNSVSGSSNHRWHLDAFHLFPNAIAAAFASHLISPEDIKKNKHRSPNICNNEKTSRAISVLLHDKLLSSDSTNKTEFQNIDMIFSWYSKSLISNISFLETAENKIYLKRFSKGPNFTLLNNIFSIINYKDICNYPILLSFDQNIARQLFRRNLLGNNNWSICTMLSNSINDEELNNITQLVTSPLEKWDAIVCPSKWKKNAIDVALQATYEYLRNRFEFPAKLFLPNVVCIQNGIWCEDYYISEAVRIFSRRLLQVNDNEIVIYINCSVANFDNSEITFLLKRLKEISENTHQSILLVMTTKEMIDRFNSLILSFENDVTSMLRVIEFNREYFHDEIYLFAAADIFCDLNDNPLNDSATETLKAMAAGLPIIVSTLGSGDEIIIDGVSGFVVPAYMPAKGLGGDLATRQAFGLDTYSIFSYKISFFTSVDLQIFCERLLTLVQDVDLRYRLGENAQKFVKQHFDWRVIFPKYENLWVEQDKLRNARELIKVNVNHPWPTYIDPFVYLNNNNSYAIDPECTFELCQGTVEEVSERIFQNEAMRLFPLDEITLISNNELTKIISLFENTSSTLNCILSHFPPNRKPYILRTIYYLIKIKALQMKRS